MKNIIFLFSVCLIFVGCSKNNNSSGKTAIPLDTASFKGTLIIGDTVRFLSDFSLPDTISSQKSLWPYEYNNYLLLSNFPITYALNYAPNDSFYRVRMFDIRPDSTISFDFYIPSFTSFSNYKTAVDVVLTGKEVPCIASVSFNMADSSGTFSMTGGAIVSPGDTVAFSFNGSFKNMLAY